MQKQAPYRLPYIDNWKIIGLVMLINTLSVFIFQYGRQITWIDYVVDAAICGATTSFIDVFYTRHAIGRRRRRGGLPEAVPRSRLMLHLPKQPWLLGTLLALAFSLLMAVISIAVAWFFEIEVFTFSRFWAWKMIYATVLTALITELCVLRYTQADCAEPGDPPQTGAGVIKNPIPRADTFKHLFNTVVDDFGFNLLVGLLFGGVIISGHDVVILATTRAGIVIGGLILGMIVTLRMVFPIAAQIKALRDSSALPVLEKGSRWVVRLPERPALFALTLLVPAMVLSAAALWAVLTFFGFEVLNFFQYFIVRTIYVTLLAKPVTKLAVLRYRQP